MNATPKYSELVVDPDVALYRVYMRNFDPYPTYFCSCEKHRFDPAGGYGACYTAESALGAFVEGFYKFRGVSLARDTVRMRKLAVLAVKEQKTVADLSEGATGLQALPAEMVAELGEPYEQCRSFAREACVSGLSGIRWCSVRDPQDKERNIALFANYLGQDMSQQYITIGALREIEDSLYNNGVERLGVKPRDPASTMLPLPL
jgi:hypothetical protein